MKPINQNEEQQIATQNSKQTTNCEMST